MKKLILMVVLAAGSGAGVWHYRAARQAPAPPEIVRVRVSHGPVMETVQAMGLIEPMRRVNVGSQVSGVIKELYVDYNSVVTQGQLLAEIEPSLFEVQVQVQEANVARLTNDIASQETQLEDLRRQTDRVRMLYDRGLVPSQQLEAAVLALRTRETTVAAAKKQLVQAEANLDAARLNLSYTKIYSPIDGVVIWRRVMKGQAVQASMTTPSFFLLASSLETLRLNAGVDEADIGRVRPGMQVRFRVGTYGDELFTGTVIAVRLNAQTVNNVVTYPVWISVPNDHLKLRPGMTATVFIEIASTGAVTQIPNDALRFRPTRALYAALGLEAPDTAVVRAVDVAAAQQTDPARARHVPLDADADSIDELFAPLPRADVRTTVWKWNEARRELTAVSVRVGVTDGTVTELLEGDISPGDELVAGVILPAAAQQSRPNQNPLLAPQRRGR